MKNVKLILCPTLLIFVLTVLLSNCGFNDPKPHHAVAQEIKDYCVFKNDSRWIYQEENSGDLDTMTVYESINFTVDPDNKFFTFESFDYRLKSSVLGYDINSFYIFQIHLQLEVNLEKSWCYAFGPYTSGTAPVEYFEANDTGEVVVRYANSNGIKYLSYHDSLAIEGKQYYKVKVFEHLSSTGPKGPRKIYWSKYIGRIRYEFFNGEVWNLIEHKVIQ